MPQRNLGERKYYITRPPADIASACEREIAETGVKATDLIADAVADRYGLQRPSERVPVKVAGVSERQGTLSLGKTARRRVKPAAAKAQYATRLPTDLARAFEADYAQRATEAGSRGQLLADILADRYKLPRASARNTTSVDQEVLPIAQAS